MSICLKPIGAEYICALPKDHAGTCGQWPAAGSPTGGNQPATQSSGVNRGSASEKMIHQPADLFVSETDGRSVAPALLTFRALMVDELEVLDQQLIAERDGVTAHSADFWVGAKHATEGAIAALDGLVGALPPAPPEGAVIQARTRLLKEIRDCISCVRCDSSAPVGDCSQFVDALIAALSDASRVRPQDEEKKADARLAPQRIDDGGDL